MCYDKESSLRSFGFAAIVCGLLWLRNNPGDRVITTMWPVVMGMQLVEYVLWENQSCNKNNHFASVTAEILLTLQPLAVLGAIIIFGNSFVPKRALYSILYLCLTVTSIYLAYYVNAANKLKLCTLTGPSNHLVWDHKKPTQMIPIWLTKTTTIIYYSIPLLLFTIKNKLMGLVTGGMLYASCLYSYFTQVKNSDEWKSYWCWLVNYLTAIPLIANA